MTAAAKNYFKGISLMMGMIIGVGLFAVPYVLSQAGAFFGLGYFLLLGAIVITTHLLYSEIILRSGLKHRLAGLAEIYLGRFWGRIVLMITVLSFYGVLLAYIIVGGEFLKILLSPILGGAVFTYQIIFFAVMAFLILFGLRRAAGEELWMTILLLLAMGAIIAANFSKIDFNNFLTAKPSNFFLPYGVILFSISGAAAVPEVLEILGQNKKKAKSLIFYGTLAAIFLILLFSFAVLGATGERTSKEAISGLSLFWGPWIVYLGAFLGFFAIATSFLPLGFYLKDQFHLDLKINKTLAWFLACFVPFFIFLFGTKDFIKIIGFTGAVFAGLEGIFIVLIYRKAKKEGRRAPEYQFNLPSFILPLIVFIFALGVIYEIWSIF